MHVCVSLSFSFYRPLSSRQVFLHRCRVPTVCVFVCVSLSLSLSLSLILSLSPSLFHSLPLSTCVYARSCVYIRVMRQLPTHCNTLQHIATHTLQRTATHLLQHTATKTQALQLAQGERDDKSWVRFSFSTTIPLLEPKHSVAACVAVC